MTETVTVRHPTGEVQSESGEPTPTFSETETVMFLEPQEDVRRSTEALEVGYVSTALYLGAGLYDFPFDEHDQIVWGDKVFDILAPPRKEWSYIRNVGSHTELVLQTIEDADATLFAGVAHPATVGGDAEVSGDAGVPGIATPGTVGGVGGT